MTQDQTVGELLDELIARANKLDGPDRVAALTAIVAAVDRAMKDGANATK
jgi:hypothetical protein